MSNIWGTKIVWDAKSIGILKQMAELGHTSAEIAAVLKTSRNSVIGKAHRHNIPLSHRPKQETWTEASLQKLREMVEAGYSASQCAAEFKMAKGTVSNKAYRMGLFFAGVKRKSDRYEVMFGISKRSSGGVKKPPKAFTEAVYIVPDVEPIPFAEITNKTCKFSVKGDKPSEFMFCGADVFDRSFCSYHYHLCYTRKQVNVAA
jgi:hypothetical protein